MGDFKQKTNKLFMQYAYCSVSDKYGSQHSIIIIFRIRVFFDIFIRTIVYDFFSSCRRRRSLYHSITFIH